MNTKNNQNGKRISVLLAMIALLAAMSGCVSNAPQPTANQTANTVPSANTATPANTPAPANISSATPAENPAAVFYGKWEKKEPGQPFRYEIFGQASKQGDNYVGKVTDQSNTVVANYTVFSDKTVEIAYLPAFYGGRSFTYPYTISDGGNKLTLDANPPIVYTKGATNTTIEKDVTFFTSGGAWKSAKDQARLYTFSNPQQEDKGWSGNYQITHPALPPISGTFEITEPGKMTLKPSTGSSAAYTYKIRGELFDFTRDRDGDTDTLGH